MEHESSNTDQKPSVQPPDHLELAHQYYGEIIIKKPSLRYAEKVFTQEQNVAFAQCSQILMSIDDIFRPISQFSALLKPPASPPNVLNPQRHHLLMQLHNAEKLISQDLTPRINAFSAGHSASTTQTDVRRREILRYLKSLIECLDELDTLLKPFFDLGVAKLHSDDREHLRTHLPSADVQVQEVPNEMPTVHHESLPQMLEDDTHSAQETRRQDDSRDEISSIDHPQPVQVHPQPSVVPGNSPNLLPQQRLFDYAQVDSVQLRKAMLHAFKPEDLELLCDDLGVNFNALKDAPYENKIKYLIEHFHNRGKYERLVQKVIQERPHLAKELFDNA